MKAFVTGISGQDGFYLSELLLEKGYEVYGLLRRSAQKKAFPDVQIIPGDVTDPNVIKEVKRINPDEIYNLAAMSHVGESFKIPSTTFQINALGTINMLEAAKSTESKFYQASTSELFGLTKPPQNESSPFYPRSPYGVSKLSAYWSTINYRESYDMETYNGILFNHESPKRGEDFVTQKIARGVADIVKKKKDFIELGNLDAVRDWGHAKDYVNGMWMMMQNDPGEYVLATGEGHTVRDFVRIAFEFVGLDWEEHVKINPDFIRPAEVHALIGDPHKMELLGWKREYNFIKLVEEMLDAALRTD